MTGRPILGITCCARATGDEMAQVVIHRYLEAALRHADCAALLVPARPDLMAASEVAGRLDGLLLTGSPSNVEPARYGEADTLGEGPFDAGRDAMSLAMIDAMIALGRPVFGICRGFQELNVAFGGTLTRDLGAMDRAVPHHSAPEAGIDEMFGYEHDVTLTAGGVLATALGAERLRVSSVHYQGVERLGQDLSVEAVAPDGVVEAVSATVNGSNILGVQWHPEWQVDRRPASAGFFQLMGRALRGDTTAWTHGEFA